VATNAQSRLVLRFDNFEVHVHSGELRKNGRPVRLQEQPFQILRALLEKPGEIVSREELKRQLWPADTFVDFDAGLNTAAKKLRDTLGDTAERPRYIETIPRRGYRFIGELEIRHEAQSGPQEGKEKDETQEIAPYRRPPVLVILGLFSVAVVMIAVLALRKSFSTPPSNIQSIAVLPFTNLSGDPSQDYFADAMTEELTSDLGNIAALRVISRTSAMHYKKTPKTTPEIAQELNVDGVIEGSVLRSGDRVRITAQLINARPERHLWSESYERDLKDILALQSEIARTIAGQVRAATTPAEQERLQPDVVNPAAYEAYMRGRSFVDRWTSEDSAEALHYFQLATQLDTKYALAYVGIAECYVYGVAGVSEEEAGKRGFAAANRALELKPDMGEAHAILGFLRGERDWDFTGAEDEMKKGIALSPNYAPAHHRYSHLLMYLGRYDEAMVETRRLIELDPVSPTPSGHLAYQYLASRQWDLAIAQFQKALAMDPSQVDEYGQLGEAYVGKRMYPEAIAELRRSAEMARNSVDYPLHLSRLGYALAQSGDIAGAKKILKEIPSQDAAYIYAGLGDRDRSFAILNDAVRRHSFSLDSGYVVELDPLRSDPRFNELLHRVHLR
jgi:TolB-like protein/DNA-binding winged helix-turn-helix (wHTH) protein/Flp pilus assembly protein TadD